MKGSFFLLFVLVYSSRINRLTVQSAGIKSKASKQRLRQRGARGDSVIEFSYETLIHLSGSLSLRLPFEKK